MQGILSSAWVKGLHEFVVIGLERERIAQEGIVLRVLAIGVFSSYAKV